MLEKLENQEAVTGRGLNQEASLTRPGATRWGSHYTTILRLITLWPSVICVLYNVHDDETDGEALCATYGLVVKVSTF